MHEVLAQRLWIGNALDARDPTRLFEREIAVVVDLAANEAPAQLAREMIYCRIPLVDGAGNSRASIEAAIRCVVVFVEHELKTLITCSAGMSRSPAIAAAAIALVKGKSLDDCLRETVSGLPHDVSHPFGHRSKRLTINCDADKAIVPIRPAERLDLSRLFRI